MAVMDVLPNGAKVMYASPELLRSLQLQLESSDSEYILVSGPGCDVWSSAVMLYQCFIGEFPFVPEDTDDSAAAPCHIRGRRRKLWVQYESMLAAQQSWVGPLNGLGIASAWLHLQQAFIVLGVLMSLFAATIACMSACVGLLLLPCHQSKQSIRCIWAPDYRRVCLNLVSTCAGRRMRVSSRAGKISPACLVGQAQALQQQPFCSCVLLL